MLEVQPNGSSLEKMGVKLVPSSAAPVTELIHAGTVSCVQIHRQIRYYQKSKTFHGANTIHPHPCYRESNLEIRGYLQGGGVDRGSKKEVVPPSYRWGCSADQPQEPLLSHTAPSPSPLDLKAGESAPCLANTKAKTLVDTWLIQGALGERSRVYRQKSKNSFLAI